MAKTVQLKNKRVVIALIENYTNLIWNLNNIFNFINCTLKNLLKLILHCWKFVIINIKLRISKMVNRIIKKFDRTKNISAD